MTNEKTGAEKSASAAAQAQPERGRSTIEFPYCALDDSEEIAAAVYAVGGSSCHWDQLAAHLKVASQGGGFRIRMMAARTYGLLTYDRGEVSLTDNGLKVIDPKFQRSARIDAFMAPPLYKAVYDRLKGQMLPPTAAIERMMETMGVAPKQKDRARQVFLRSAKHAGFFELASDRLVQPNTNNFGAASNLDQAAERESQREIYPPANNGNGGSGSYANNSGHHPFIEGLLKTLPKAESEWQLPARAKWLQAASNIFDLMYTSTSDDEVIEVKVTKAT